MAKLTLTDIASAFQSTQQLNDNFALIEAAFENTLSRDGTSPNQMNANLDMNGFALTNASILNIEIGGTSIQDGIDYAQEWAVKAEDSLISVAAGGDGATDYSSLHWAAKADASATSAAADEASTASLYDQFDDRYLGSKAAPPALDNDGDALLTGAMYFNSVSNDMWIWNGAAWGLIGTTQNSAASVTIADSGGYYTGANVEVALQEVGADIVSLQASPVLVVLDEPVELVASVVDTGGWVTYDMSGGNAAAQAAHAAGATKVILKCFASLAATTGNDHLVSLYLRKTGSGDAENNDSLVAATRDFYHAAPTIATGYDVNTTIVNLDGDSDFDYNVNYVGAGGTFAGRFVMVGYYV